MKLSIIVLNYKSKELVKYFLKRVLSFKFEFEWEVVVVDNDSRDGIEEMMRKDFKNIKFIKSKKNIGMGGGNNLGIKNSSGEYALIANPDVTLSEKAVLKMIEFLDENKKVGAVGPRVLSPDKTRQDTCYRWPKFFTFLYRRTLFGKSKKGKEYLDKFLYKDNDLSRALKVDWILGGCFMARREALAEIDLFDERFFLFLEDTDLCRRLWKARWEVWYLPEAQVIHLPHRLSAGWGSLKDVFSKFTWVHLCSWVKYFIKWGK